MVDEKLIISCKILKLLRNKYRNDSVNDTGVEKFLNKKKTMNHNGKHGYIFSIYKILVYNKRAYKVKDKPQSERNYLQQNISVHNI